MNPIEGEHCMRCGRLLDVQRAYETAQRERQKDDVLLRLASLLLTRGMADDAAKIIHDAGLGPTLQQLVRHDEAAGPKHGRL